MDLSLYFRYGTEDDERDAERIILFFFYLILLIAFTLKLCKLALACRRQLAQLFHRCCRRSRSCRLRSRLRYLLT